MSPFWEHAVIPGTICGLGFLLNSQIMSQSKQGIDPTPAALYISLVWDFFILPVTIVSAFVFLPWLYSIAVFPIQLLAAGAAGLLTHVVDEILLSLLAIFFGAAYSLFQIWSLF